jgi:5'-deoxynucleotidase YfbR-like HD superfamily hydrolase
MLVLACSPVMPSAALLAACLVHDLPEFRTGDVPATAKWSHPELEAVLKTVEQKWFVEYEIRYVEQLCDAERKLLKFCDRAELAWRCIEEINMGNRYALEVLHNILGAIEIMGGPPTDKAAAMLEQIEQEVAFHLGTKFYRRVKAS